jgi:hypothetical protein
VVTHHELGYRYVPESGNWHDGTCTRKIEAFSAATFRVEPAVAQPAPPPDPYVRNERLRFLGNQSLGTTLAHHFCCPAWPPQRAWRLLGVGRTYVSNSF